MLIEFPQSQVPSIWKLYWNKVSQRPAFKFFVLAAFFLTTLFSVFMLSKKSSSFPAYAYFEKLTRPENISLSLALSPQAIKDRSAFRSFEGMLAQHLLLEQSDVKKITSFYQNKIETEALKGPYSSFYEKLGEISLLIAKGAHNEAFKKSCALSDLPIEGQLYVTLLAHKLAKIENNEELVLEKAKEIRFFLFDKDSPLTTEQKNFWIDVLGKDPQVIKDFYSQSL